jgi:tripartite-type tricarboxylate transporter receptor subunit TctC
MTGTSIVHIPYKGGAPLIVDLMSGQVDMAFVGLATVIGQIKTGKLIPIAIASDKRSPFLPNVPAAAEAGLKGYNVDTWYGILAPAKTPMEVVKKINADVNAVLSKDETKRRLADLGSSPAPMTVEAFRAHYDNDLVNFKKLIQETGIKAE